MKSLQDRVSPDALTRPKKLSCHLGIVLKRHNKFKKNREKLKIVCGIRPLQAFTGLCRSLHASSGLCSPLLVFAVLCRSLNVSAGLYRPLQVFAGLCRSLQVSADPYRSLQVFIGLYRYVSYIDFLILANPKK